MEMTFACQFAELAAEAELGFEGVGDYDVTGLFRLSVPEARFEFTCPCLYNSGCIRDFMKQLGRLHESLNGKATLTSSAGEMRFYVTDRKRGRVAFDFEQEGVPDTTFHFGGNYTPEVRLRVIGLEIDQSYLPRLVNGLREFLRSLPSSE